MTSLFLRGSEFDLGKLDADVVVNTKFVGVTLSAMAPNEEGGWDRMFAHTYFEDVDDVQAIGGLTEIMNRAIAAFKEALGEAGGWIVENEEKEI